MIYVKINCVCLEEEEMPKKEETKPKISKESPKGETEKKKEPIMKYTCQANIGTSSWIMDKNFVDGLCKKDEFAACKRLFAFIEYTKAANTLNIKST